MAPEGTKCAYNYTSQIFSWLCYYPLHDNVILSESQRISSMNKCEPHKQNMYDTEWLLMHFIIIT